MGDRRRGCCGGGSSRSCSQGSRRRYPRRRRRRGNSVAHSSGRSRSGRSRSGGSRCGRQSWSGGGGHRSPSRRTRGRRHRRTLRQGRGPGSSGRSSADDRSDRRLACNRRRWRNNVRSLARQRNNAPRCRRRARCRRSRGVKRGDRGRDLWPRSLRWSRNRRLSRRWRLSRSDAWTRRRRRHTDRRLRLLALQNRLESVARLRSLRKIDLRTVVDRLSRPSVAAARATVAAILQVVADPLRLIRFDRARVRLSTHADRFERVQNRPALYFQFPCQIVDANFTHPSLFTFPKPLAVHVSLVAGGIAIVQIVVEIRASALGVEALFMRHG